MTEPRSLDPVLFILSAPRSGTTLTRVSLAGHPRLFSPPEMVLAPFEGMAQRQQLLDMRYWEKGGLRRALMYLDDIDVPTAKARVAEMADWSIEQVYRHLQDKLDARGLGEMLVDKCLHICLYPERLASLPARFPNARYLWLVRHPGSVIRSVENMPMAEVMLSGFEGDAAKMWSTVNDNIGQFLATQPDSAWLRLRYEDLISDGRSWMQRFCDWIELPFDEGLLKPYEGDRMREGPKGARAIGDPNMAGRGKIQPELATRWLKGFDVNRLTERGRVQCSEYGYDLSALQRPPIALVGEQLSSLFALATKFEQSIQHPGDLDQVEGRRFLLRMLSASVDTFVEWSDHERPRFHHAEGPTRKMFADCPDTDYWRAPIRTDDGEIYRLDGVAAPGTLYLGVLFYRRGGQVGERLVDDQLQMDAEGRFSVRVTARSTWESLPEEQRGGLWLLGDGDETALMVRQYFADRGTEPAVSLCIERIDRAPKALPLTAQGMTKSLARSERMLKAIFERTLNAWKMVRQVALNKFMEIPAGALFPTPDNRYLAAWYRFGGDQLMLIRGRLPKARYFSFCLYNAWMESLDYERHTVHRNHTRIETDEDGHFEICLAHRDPGHPNWIDTTGHHAGYVIARSLLLEGDMPELAIQVYYEKEYQALRSQEAGS